MDYQNIRETAQRILPFMLRNTNFGLDKATVESSVKNAIAQSWALAAAFEQHGERVVPPALDAAKRQAQRPQQPAQPIPRPIQPPQAKPEPRPDINDEAGGGPPAIASLAMPGLPPSPKSGRKIAIKK